MINMSIVVKIGGGFKPTLPLLVRISIVSWNGINSVIRGLKKYQDSVDLTNSTNQLKAIML